MITSAVYFVAKFAIRNNGANFEHAPAYLLGTGARPDALGIVYSYSDGSSVYVSPDRLTVA